MYTAYYIGVIVLCICVFPPFAGGHKKIKGFPHSRMGRDLATIRATFNGKPILIMTSHLESEKQSADERKAQFNKVCSLAGRALGSLVRGSKVLVQGSFFPLFMSLGKRTACR